MKKILSFLFFLTIIPIASIGQTDENNDTDTLKILPYPPSFSDLVKQFEGKVIYIDVLASWCKPCIAELQKSKELEDYFKKNDIIKLYITIDNINDIQKCVEMLKRESIMGYLATYHATDTKYSPFTKEIENLFLYDKNKQFIGIPRYAIVDKKGKLVIDNAARPSATDEIKKQLETVLRAQ